jgi:oxygen-independent coproporphyrinogen-3 oxidase
VLPLLDDLKLNRLVPATLTPCEVEALYVHIPFCFHKCHYCDFYSITRQTPERMTAFVDRILGEARLWTTLAPQVASRVIPRTIFFGGGTPSLLPLVAMQRLLKGLRTVFDLDRVQEWTIEVNPATTNLDYLQMLRALGVDRLSFGAQSFDPRDLIALERHHHPDDVLRSLDLARQAGFDRLNIDLIYAIPGQSIESWRSSLEQAIALNTEHISAYALTYEPNTPLTVLLREGRIAPADESTELDMLRTARTTLARAGLPAYEISNHAKPNAEAQHNLAYWRGLNYLGLGPSAASHLSGTRFKNIPHIGEWESAIDAHQLPARDVEFLSPDERFHERFIFGLRLAEGIDPHLAASDHQVSLPDDFIPKIDQLKSLKLIELHPDHPKRLRLSDRGIEVADTIAAEFAR